MGKYTCEWLPDGSYLILNNDKECAPEDICRDFNAVIDVLWNVVDEYNDSFLSDPVDFIERMIKNIKSTIKEVE